MAISRQPSAARSAAEEGEEDLYLKMKELQNKLEMIEIQEDYIKTELNHLKAEEIRSKEEVSRILPLHEDSSGNWSYPFILRPHGDTNQVLSFRS